MDILQIGFNCLLLSILSTIPAPVKELTLEQKADKYIETYLSDLSKGLDGTLFFCRDSQKGSFFAYRSSRVLRSYMTEVGGSYVIQVDSSTKGGMQITKNWEFDLANESPEDTSILKEAGTYGICIKEIRGN
jgi:hypothetical protein